MTTPLKAPLTIFEKAAEDAKNGVTVDWNTLPRAPHCDAYVLHALGECQFCDKAVDLQEERERLRVSNTGHNNRKWPCPATTRRTVDTIHHWPHNRPTPKGETPPTIFDGLVKK